MANMQREKTPMPQQDPILRKENFEEVSLGYTHQQALNEAERCLHCKNRPCMKGCPVGVHIPDFIHKLQQGDMEGAYQIVRGDSALPAICSRVCPQENQCEKLCVRGIKDQPVAIGRLERYVADWGMARGERPMPPREKKNKKIAVVGSGPAGLSCAGELQAMGYDVTIFEALHAPGGVLAYGIPQFRLPKELVEKEIRALEELGVAIETNVVVGKSVTLDELMEEEGFAAVFIGNGAGLPRFMGIPGEMLGGVYGANEFLSRINLMKAHDFPTHHTPIRVGKRAAVIGGGNVAMDAARCALRMGAEEVKVIYRRTENEMPARREEIENAREEGVTFEMLANPVEILGDEQGRVQAIRLVQMQLGEKDPSGRQRPVEKKGSEYTIPVDTVIIAIGNSPNPLLSRATPGLKTQPWGGLEVDEETMATSRPFVYAGGDGVTGAATVIQAMGAGKKAAAQIDKDLEKQAQ